MLFVLALAALIVAPIAGLLARDGGGDQGSGGPTSVVQEFSPTVEVAGPNLPLLAGDAPESIPDDAVGMPAPRMEGQDFEGFPVVVPVEGTATVLVFLAHWCPHCQAEFPRLLDAWITDDLPPDVRVVAVPTAQAPARPNWPPSDWMLGGETAWDEPVLLDTRDQDVARAMGVTGYPFFVVVAPDGTVAARSSGEHDAEGLAAMVDFAAALD